MASTRLFDAFISHASANRAQAARLESAIGARRAWFDRSDIHLGALLGRELLANIRKSRSLVLVWSKAASQSPWVQGEWIAAVTLGKPIVPICLDKAPLPQCLTNTLWQPAAKGPLKGSIADVARAVRGRRPRGASFSPSMRLPNAPLEAEVQRLGSAQLSMLNAFYRAPAAARREQRRLETQTRALAARYPDDPRPAILWAYNEKNAVILDHDAAISAGVKVVDERLDEARWRFLHALWLDPLDAEALNGLGTIAWFGHDLDSAEFFVRAALRRVPNYGAAQHDLALILALKKKNRDPKPGPFGPGPT